MEIKNMSVTRPIFLSGLGHSGTTMVKNLLDWHKDLYACPPTELNFFKNLDHLVYGTGLPLDLGEKGTMKSGYCKDIETNKRFFTNNTYIKRFNLGRGFDRDKFNKTLMDSKPTNDKELYACLMKSMALATEGIDASKINHYRYVVKHTFSEKFVPELLSWFPDAKFIYILRNPHARLVSSRRWHLTTGSYPRVKPIVDAMGFSYYLMEKWLRVYQDSFMVLRYESLLENPEETMQSVAEFLDIENTPSLFEQTILGRPHKGHSSYTGQAKTTIDKSYKDRWKKDIHPLEVKMLNNTLPIFLKDHQHLGPEVSRIECLKPAKGESAKTYLKNRMDLAQTSGWLS